MNLPLSIEHPNFIEIDTLTTTPVIFYDLTEKPINQDSVYNWVNDFRLKMKPPFLYISNGTSYDFNYSISDLWNMIKLT